MNLYIIHCKVTRDQGITILIGHMGSISIIYTIYNSINYISTAVISSDQLSTDKLTVEYYIITYCYLTSYFNNRSATMLSPQPPSPPLKY